jgi:VanZ family protein
MAGVHSYLKYWLPVMVWAAVIFSASTDALSSPRTSRIIGPILLWLNPDISPETIERVQWVARKTAHVLEYAILGVLLWIALRKPRWKELRSWQWRPAAWSLAWSFLYALSDEGHQLFVASREASVRDVFLDTAGAALGLCFLWMWGRWRRAW